MIYPRWHASQEAIEAAQAKASGLREAARESLAAARELYASQDYADMGHALSACFEQLAACGEALGAVETLLVTPNFRPGQAPEPEGPPANGSTGSSPTGASG